MRFERMQHRVALCGRYFVLVAIGETNYRRLDFHLSKIGGFVTLRPCDMGQFFRGYFKNYKRICKWCLYSISSTRSNRYGCYTEYWLMIYIQPNLLKAFSYEMRSKQ